MKTEGEDYNKRFISACANNKVDIARALLLDKRVNPSANNNEAIQDACRFGREEIVKLLLQDGRADPSINHNIAVMMAAAKNERELVHMLLLDDRVFYSLTERQLTDLKYYAPSVKACLNACRDTVLTILLIYRHQSLLSQLPKDILLLITKRIWRSWPDTVWLQCGSKSKFETLYEIE